MILLHINSTKGLKATAEEIFLVFKDTDIHERESLNHPPDFTYLIASLSDQTTIKISKDDSVARDDCYFININGDSEEEVSRSLLESKLPISPATL